MGQGDISMRDMVYRIWRIWRVSGRREIIRDGLSWEDANSHCVSVESMGHDLFWDMCELVPVVLVLDGVGKNK